MKEYLLKPIISSKTRVCTLLLLFLFITQSPIFGQNEVVKIKQGKITLQELIDEIEKQTNFLVVFSNQEIDSKTKITINIQSGKVSDYLDILSKNLNIGYEFNNSYINLNKRNGTKAISDKIEITGKVNDVEGEPLPGVSILIKGTQTGTVSDYDGNFSITVNSSEDILIFSYLGFRSQEIKVLNKRQIDVVLHEDVQLMDEVVVVGYGVQKKVNLTGSVASIGNKDLTVAPVANTTNALAGRLPGLTVIQNSGQPGSDGASLNIRGFDSPLIIVDGVEASFHTIDPSMIESISILKDASASIYGSRAGNGVILVTTKRGVQQKPTITFSTNLTLQGITSMPKPTSAGQYAELEREKWIQSGRPVEQAPFTEEQIQKYYDGSDPQYPDTDWKDELIRDWAPQQQYNVSIRGGSDAIRYYGFIGYLNQQSMWKNNGGHYDRYNLQSNIDASITDNLSFQLDLATIIEGRKFPGRPQGAGPNNVWEDYWNTLPTYPSTLPDPSKIPYADGGGTGGAHITSNYDLMGYDKWNNQNFKGTASLTYKIPEVTGLSAKILINAIANYNRTSNFRKPVKYYRYDIASETYTLAGSLGNSAQLSEGSDMNRSITTQASLNYDRVFSNVHNFSALALFEGIDYKGNYFSASRDNFITPTIEQLYAGDNSTAKNNGSASEQGRMSFVGRLNYSYKSTYLLEATLRADASAKFSPSKRWGYFPSVSAAWRMSEESFMKNVTWLDNLKIRTSYGRSGNDNVVNFQYLSGYLMLGEAGYLFGDTPLKAIYPSVIPNPNLSWEEIEIVDGGFEFSIFNRKLYGEVDAFYRKRTGIPGNRMSTLPNTFGASLPQENLNSLDNRGFELTLGTVFEINEFSFDISGNIAWSRDKWIHYEEQEYTDSDEIRIKKASGNWTDRLFGYKSDKLFGSQAEIDALAFQQDNNNNTTLRPGDIRYLNLNGDDRLDWRDQTEIGAKWPHWTTGINLNINYKDFDFTALFQGAFGYYTDVWLLRSNRVLSEEVYNLRWTEESNNTDALVPRLGGTDLNASGSDYRYKKSGYLRLKSASLGYNIPKNILHKISIEQARVTVSGTNLLTFDKLKKYNIDPEVPFGHAGFYYPQQRTFSLGLNVSF